MYHIGESLAFLSLPLVGKTTFLPRIVTLLTNNTTDWSPLHVLGQFFFLAIILAGFLFIAYYITKKIGISRFHNPSSNNLQIVEGIYIGSSQSILLIRTGKMYYTVGVTKDKITFLTDIDIDNITINNTKPPEFKSFLDGRIKNAVDKMRDNKKE